MPNRTRTPAYVFFFILFWPDTWRIVIGVLASWLLTPLLLSPEMKWFQAGMLYIMIACIGYVASAAPARSLSRLLRGAILKNNRPWQK